MCSYHKLNNALYFNMLDLVFDLLNLFSVRFAPKRNHEK